MDDPSIRIPDAIEPIVAFRVWHYSIDDGRARLDPLSGPDLFGVGVSPWEGACSDWVTASCSCPSGADPSHGVPAESCFCGFYSVKELEMAVAYASILYLTTPVVIGRIELSGKVIEHELGYRAERARIAQLIPLRGTERSVMVLANRLGIGLSPAVEPLSEDEIMGGHLRGLAIAAALRPAPQKVLPEPEPAWSLIDGIVIAALALTAVVLWAMGSWQPPPGLVVLALLYGDRIIIEPIGRGFRQWRDRPRTPKLKVVGP